MSAVPHYITVSIHAPRCRGAMPWPPISSVPASRSFQSTLPVAGERCIADDDSRCLISRFNPRSPLPGSDAAALGVALVGLVVSIHAPRCRGAMHRAALFNSGAYPVSIHAPRCRGAMHAGRPVGPHGRLGFNPRSPLPGSDAAPVLGLGGKAKMFQSTLPVAGERCLLRYTKTPLVIGFQSTLPVAGERCRKHDRRHWPDYLFQSTLPVAGERCNAPMLND